LLRLDNGSNQNNPGEIGATQAGSREIEAGAARVGIAEVAATDV